MYVYIEVYMYDIIVTILIKHAFDSSVDFNKKKNRFILLGWLVGLSH